MFSLTSGSQTMRTLGHRKGNNTHRDRLGEGDGREGTGETGRDNTRRNA